MIIVFVGT